MPHTTSTARQLLLRTTIASRSQFHQAQCSGPSRNECAQFPLPAVFLQRFGNLVWGETPVQAVARICNDSLFPGIDARERFCSIDVGRPTYADFAEGRLDEFAAQAMAFNMDFLANHHSRVALYQENKQLVASDPMTVMVAPITLFGVPYELHLSFEGLDEYLALWHLEYEAEMGEVSPYCFVFDEKTFCEYPPVLTRVQLKTDDPRNVDVCDSIQGVIDDRYGAELHRV